MQIHARILEAEVHLRSSCAGVLLDRSIQVESSSPGATTLVRVVSQSTRKPRASVMKFAGVILWRRMAVVSSRFIVASDERLTSRGTPQQPPFVYRLARRIRACRLSGPTSACVRCLPFNTVHEEAVHLATKLLPVGPDGDQLGPRDNDGIGRRRILEVVYQLVVHRCKREEEHVSRKI